MKIGTCNINWNLVEDFEIDSRETLIRDVAGKSVIEEEGLYTSLLNSSCTISFLCAGQAYPHRDEDWRECVFLNVLLKGAVEVGDEDHNSVVLRKGDIFVVDPMKIHWALTKTDNFKVSKRYKSFILLQFEIPITGYKDKLKQALCTLQGVKRTPEENMNFVPRSWTYEFYKAMADMECVK